MSKWKLSPKITVIREVFPCAAMHRSHFVFHCWKIFLNVISVTVRSAVCDSFWISSTSQNGCPLTSSSYGRTVRSPNVPNKSLNHPIHPIWHFANLDCSPLWKWSWRSFVLRWLTRFKKNYRQHSWLSQKVHLKKYSNSGKRGETGALQHRGTTSSVTVISGLNFHLDVFYGRNLGTLWSHLVYFEWCNLYNQFAYATITERNTTKKKLFGITKNTKTR